LGGTGLLPARLSLLGNGKPDDEFFDEATIRDRGTQRSQSLPDNRRGPDANLIKPFDPDQGKKYASYLPFWA
jgi:hypothetical protein